MLTPRQNATATTTKLSYYRIRLRELRIENDDDQETPGGEDEREASIALHCTALLERQEGINKYKNLWSSPNVTLEEGSSFALSIDHRSTEWQDTPALKLFARKRGGS